MNSNTNSTSNIDIDIDEDISIKGINNPVTKKCLDMNLDDNKNPGTTELDILNSQDDISNEMKYILKILGFEVSNEKELFGILIDRDMLLKVDIEQKLASMIGSL